LIRPEKFKEMSGPNSASATTGSLQQRAKCLRRHMLTMVKGKGQGYLGQGLGIADVLAVLYFREMRYDPANPNWPDRDRFLLSTGHYSIALWAALAEAGILGMEELPTYGADGSRLEMSTLDSTPGVEIIDGSPGQGLGQGVGMALGLRLEQRDSRVFVELSDGELQEGSTWEAAMAASHFKLDSLVAIVDGNQLYMRLLRGRVPDVLDPANYRFELGRAAWLRQGRDVGIISTGLMTERALDASEALAQEGIRAAVLHVPTLKPFDREAVCELAGSARTLVSVENHVVTGGLGTMVADTLVAHRISKPLFKIGIPDKFIECGSVPFLQAKYGLLSQDIVATNKKALDG